MTTSEDWERALIGWLVIVRHQIDAEDRFMVMDVPVDVKLAWIDRGWACEVPGDEPDEKVLALTDKAHVVSDLHAAEWGIDVLT